MWVYIPILPRRILDMTSFYTILDVKKLVESTQEESDSSEEKICFINMKIITLVDLQESGDIGDQECLAFSLFT